MNALHRQAAFGLFRLLLSLAALLFIPAWTLHYWQAWLFLAAFFLPILAITLYLAKNDPRLLARRVTAGPSAEKQKSQRIIQALASIFFLAIFIVCSLDHRLAWSAVPPAVCLAGDFLVLLGLFIVFRVFQANSHASGIIEVASAQTVVSAGPYAFVRHPMYSGALLMLVGVPLALGSWWGLLAFPPIAVVIIWRLLEEEKFLARNLPGYADYQRKVRRRLLPLVW